MRDPFNDLRMRMKEALDNLWARITGKFDTVHGRVDAAEAHIDDVEGELNTTKGRVTSVEGRMTTAEGQITGLDNRVTTAEGQIRGLDGRVDNLEDAVNDIDAAMIKGITFNGIAVPKDSSGNVALQETDPTVPPWAKQVKAKTSDFTNDGDGQSVYATIRDVQSAMQNNYELIDLHTHHEQSYMTLYEIWTELKKIPIKTNRAFSADAKCSGLFTNDEAPGDLQGIISPHPQNYADTLDDYYFCAYDEYTLKVFTGWFRIGEHPVTGEMQFELLELHTIGDGGGGSGAVNTVTFNGVTHQPDTGGDVSLTETDPTVPAWAKAASKPTYTAQEVGAKAIQSPVSDPAASGTAVAFIDSISQNAQGVITLTKKTVAGASQSAAGLMSAADKTKLDGIAAGAAVTSVNNQTGAVSITPANIGAVSKSGDTMTGPLTVQSDAIALTDTAKGNLSLYMHISGSGDFGIYSNGYYNGSSFIPSGKWLVYRDPNDVIRLGNAVPVDDGGTGATTPDGACANIGAVKKSGDTMTGPLITNSAIIQNSGYIFGENAATNHALKLGHAGDDVMQFFEYGGQFDFYQSQSGTNTLLFQIKNGVSSKPLPVNNGGTGATTPAGARANLEITPANIGALAVDGSNAMHNWIAIDTSLGSSNEQGINIAMSGGKNWYLYPTGNGSSFSIAGHDGTNWFWALSVDMATRKVSLNQPLEITSGGTGATTPAQARANLEITPANIGAMSLKSIPINDEASSNANIQLIRKDAGVPIAFLGQTNNGVRVYAAFGNYNDNYWGAKIFDNASNPVASTTIVGTLYYA